VTPHSQIVLPRESGDRYGTTMRGMMTEHGVHADDYLAYVHQIDHSPLQPIQRWGRRSPSFLGAS
jgi:putative hydrolase of the HAD superfamily